MIEEKNYGFIFEDIDFDDYESINELIEKLEKYDCVHLYFSSLGGLHSTSIFLADYINNRGSNNNSTILHLVDTIHSAGVFFLLSTSCPIVMTDSFDSLMLHPLDALNYAIRKYPKKDIMIQNTQELHNRWCNKLMPYLSDEKFEKFKDGEDIYLNRAETKELLQHRIIEI